MNKEEKELCKQVMLDLNIVRYHKTISECMVEYGKRLAKQEAIEFHKWACEQGYQSGGESVYQLFLNNKTIGK